MQAILTKQIFTGDAILEQQAILIASNKIIDVIPISEVAANIPILDFTNYLIAPGFIDVQVNGGGGVLFSANPNLTSLKTIAQTLRRLGTTSFLPTLISSDQQTMQAARVAVAQALEAEIPGIRGIHYEGPWLNVTKRGIHAQHNISSSDDNIFKKLAVGKTLITLAPEIVSEQQIKQLIEQGITVFAGHTNASYKEMQQAFAVGLTGVTHLFNACSGLMSREAGVVGATLLADQIWCTVIVDGYHISYPSLQIALNCKDRKKFILISDAMTALGSSLKEFTLGTEKIYVNAGRYTNAAGTLAGAALDIATALQNVVNNLKLSLVEALRMTSTNAAEMLGIDHTIGRIAPGMQADLVALDPQFQVQAVVQQGQLIDLGFS